MRGAKIQPKDFLTEVFGNPLGSWTSAPSGHGCPRQNACFSRIWTALTEVLGRDIRANDPWMSARCPSQKLTLWAVFSVLESMRGANLGGFGAHRRGASRAMGCEAWPLGGFGALSNLFKFQEGSRKGTEEKTT